MATLAPGTRVVLRPGVRETLRFAPPAGDDLLIAVHAGALRAGAGNLLTLVVAMRDDAISWLGALDERMLATTADDLAPDPRRLVRSQLLAGNDLWRVVWPGPLLTATGDVATTVYGGDRPWLVVGETTAGERIACPLNSASGGAKWWTPLLEPADLPFAGSKSSLVELAHLWAIGRPADARKAISGRGQDTVGAAIRRYYG